MAVRSFCHAVTGRSIRVLEGSRTERLVEADEHYVEGAEVDREVAPEPDPEPEPEPDPEADPEPEPEPEPKPAKKPASKKE